MKVNFSEAGEEKSFEPAPRGTYVLIVTDGEVRESGPQSKKPGAEMINWELTIAEGDYEGRKVWTNTMCEGKGVFFLKQLLSATGKFEIDDDLDFEISDVIGSKVRATLGVKPKYNDPDEMENEVKKFKPIGDTSTDESLLP